MTRLLQPRRLLAAAICALLAACGGGGSDGGDGGGEPTGLVPTPPALGDTLYADATVLRPLTPGASWVYAGLTPSNISYTNTVTHAAASEGVMESSTNTLATGADTINVVARSGSILQIAPIDFNGDGVDDVRDVIELRSPVRANDQYTAFDQRLTSAVPDIDGDARAESLDVAVYTRVIRAESVTPPGLPAIASVRVDRVVAARVLLSANSSFGPTVRATQSVWYASGIGVVKQRLDAPADDGVSRDYTTETITSWTGL